MPTLELVFRVSGVIDISILWKNIGKEERI
jgi:hypothetical protein